MKQSLVPRSIEHNNSLIFPISQLRGLRTATDVTYNVTRRIFNTKCFSTRCDYNFHGSAAGMCGRNGAARWDVFRWQAVDCFRRSGGGGGGSLAARRGSEKRRASCIITEPVPADRCAAARPAAELTASA